MIRTIVFAVSLFNLSWAHAKFDSEVIAGLESPRVQVVRQSLDSLVDLFKSKSPKVVAGLDSSRVMAMVMIRLRELAADGRFRNQADEALEILDEKLASALNLNDPVISRKIYGIIKQAGYAPYELRVALENQLASVPEAVSYTLKTPQMIEAAAALGQTSRTYQRLLVIALVDAADTAVAELIFDELISFPRLYDTAITELIWGLVKDNKVKSLDSFLVRAAIHFGFSLHEDRRLIADTINRSKIQGVARPDLQTLLDVDTTPGLACRILF